MGSDREREDGEQPSPTSERAGEGEARAEDADESAPAKPRKKKRRKKKKATKKKSATKKATRKSAETDGADADASDDESKDEGDVPKRRIPWLAIILVIAAVELFLFGNRGRIQVCVAKEGVHDFDLVDTPRTDDNAARYPSCETRLNIGMKSRYDDLKTDAVVQACRRANMFRGKEAILTCAVEADGWTHRVTADFVKPWEPEYRDKLFWFLE